MFYRTGDKCMSDVGTTLECMSNIRTGNECMSDVETGKTCMSNVETSLKCSDHVQYQNLSVLVSHIRTIQELMKVCLMSDAVNSSVCLMFELTWMTGVQIYLM